MLIANLKLCTLNIGTEVNNVSDYFCKNTK